MAGIVSYGNLLYTSQGFTLGTAKGAVSQASAPSAYAPAAMTLEQVGRAAGLVFLQNSDDLLFREAATFHVLVLSMGQNELQTGLDQRGKVKRSGRADEPNNQGRHGQGLPLR